MNSSLTITAQDWIARLGLIPHPEGGYYRETYRAERLIPREALAPDFPGVRAVATSIYFLLNGADPPLRRFSAFHRLRSDEMWHFYAGGTLTVHVLEPAAEAGAQETYRHRRIQLGSNPETGEVFQAVVTAGCWFASGLRDAESYALVGCTVAPGFDFDDFEIAKREELIRLYPQQKRLIEEFTRV
jgi:uncharacterized protein